MNARECGLRFCPPVESRREPSHFRGDWRAELTKRVWQLISWLSILFGVVALVASWEVVADEPSPGAPPNIVLIYADDMGYGDLAVQSPDSKIPTPHLDRLASEGICFTDGHSSSGVCTLSRYALLTGEYHWRHVDRNADFPRPSVIARDQLTLPEMLSQAGYNTACIGKWHLGWGWHAIQRSGPAISAEMKDQTYTPQNFDWSKPIPDGPTDHGFDYYFGDDVPNRPPYTWIENDRVLDEPNAELIAHERSPAEGHWETERGPMAEGWKFEAVMPRLTEKTVCWIGEQRDSGQPFFLYFSMTLPHAPIVPTPESRGKSQAGGYGDYIYQGDQVVGEVLQALDDNGLRDNTIVIFTSDNGPASYAFERVRKYGHRSMGPFRGIKGDVWEGGHRMPFLIRWPGQIEPGRVSDELVSQIDLMATLAAVVDAELPAGAARDSQNILPLLRGEPNASTGRDTLVYNTVPHQYAIRQGEWVFIDAASGSATGAPAWYDAIHQYAPNQQDTILTNLKNDIEQKENVADEYPARAAELKRALRRMREGVVQHKSP